MRDRLDELAALRLESPLLAKTPPRMRPALPMVAPASPVAAAPPTSPVAANDTAAAPPGSAELPVPVNSELPSCRLVELVTKVESMPVEVAEVPPPKTTLPTTPATRTVAAPTSTKAALLMLVLAYE